MGNDALSTFIQGLFRVSQYALNTAPNWTATAPNWAAKETEKKSHSFHCSQSYFADDAGDGVYHSLHKTGIVHFEKIDCRIHQQLVRDLYRLILAFSSDPLYLTKVKSTILPTRFWNVIYHLALYKGEKSLPQESFRETTIPTNTAELLRFCQQSKQRNPSHFVISLDYMNRPTKGHWGDTFAHSHITRVLSREASLLPAYSLVLRSHVTRRA